VLRPETHGGTGTIPGAAVRYLASEGNRFASAVVMIRSISRGSGSPEAAHIMGNPDEGVIPGMVLISFTRTSPDGV
jgi:hypothetical protein